MVHLIELNSAFGLQHVHTAVSEFQLCASVIS